MDEPSREEPAGATHPDSAGEQDQDGPAANRKKTFLEHAEDATDELAEFGRLFTQ